MVLLLVLAGLLGAFVVGVALLTLARRVKRLREQQRVRASPRSPDPWVEAGRRTEPFDPPGASG